MSVDSITCEARKTTGKAVARRDVVKRRDGRRDVKENRDEARDAGEGKERLGAEKRKERVGMETNGKE